MNLDKQKEYYEIKVKSCIKNYVKLRFSLVILAAICFTSSLNTLAYGRGWTVDWGPYFYWLEDMIESMEKKKYISIREKSSKKIHQRVIETDSG